MHLQRGYYALYHHRWVVEPFLGERQHSVIATDVAAAQGDLKQHKPSIEANEVVWVGRGGWSKCTWGSKLLFLYSLCYVLRGSNNTQRWSFFLCPNSPSRGFNSNSLLCTKFHIYTIYTHQGRQHSEERKEDNYGCNVLCKRPVLRDLGGDFPQPLWHYLHKLILFLKNKKKTLV